MDEYGRIHYRQIDLEPSEGKPEANDVAEERAYSGKTNAQPSFQHTAPMTYEPILHSDTWRDVVEKFKFGPLPDHEWPADVLYTKILIKLGYYSNTQAFLLGILLFFLSFSSLLVLSSSLLLYFPDFVAWIPF